MRNFKGKTAVVTGASSGIGYALAERCAGEGMNVVLASRNEEKLVSAQQRLKSDDVKTLCVPTDVVDGQAVSHLADLAYTEFSAVHLLINNAGSVVMNDIRPVWVPSLDDWTYRCLLECAMVIGQKHPLAPGLALPSPTMLPAR